MPYVQYHDTTYSPAGLWNLNGSLADSSGNGFTLTVEAGTIRYTDVYPGLRGALLDGATRLVYSTADATLQILGDVTLEMLLIPLTRTVTGKYMCCNASGTGSSVNVLYSVGMSSGSWEWQSHHGTNVNDIYDIDNNPALMTLNHIAVTRTSDVVQNYLNGVAWGAASSALTTPTGGSDSEFRIGSAGTSAPTCIIASVKVIASALTATQIKGEYNNTLGNFYGYL
jgi:hypothetical protein